MKLTIAALCLLLSVVSCDAQPKKGTIQPDTLVKAQANGSYNCLKCGRWMTSRDDPYTRDESGINCCGLWYKVSKKGNMQVRFIRYLNPQAEPTSQAKSTPLKSQPTYTAFTKVVKQHGTWVWQLDWVTTTLAFNASNGTAFTGYGHKLQWKEIAANRLQVSYIGENMTGTWEWELSDDQKAIFVTEVYVKDGKSQTRTFSLTAR